MPTLHWIGKEKVINHHLDVPYRVLEHQYGFDAATGKTDSPTNSGNKIIHGDNLEALKSQSGIRVGHNANGFDRGYGSDRLLNLLYA